MRRSFIISMWFISSIAGCSCDGDKSVSNDLDVGSDAEDVGVALDCSRAKIAAGLGMSCAIGCDGALRCWGEIAEREPPPGWSSPVATRYGPDTTWRDVDIDFEMGCGVTDDGEIWCWGMTYFDLEVQLTPPVRIGTEDDWQHVEVSHLSETPVCGIKEDGSLWCLSPDATSREVSVESKWNDVALSGDRVCAISETETLYCFGGPFGTIDNPTQFAGEFTAVESSFDQFFLLHPEGWLRALHARNGGEPVQIRNGLQFSKLSSGCGIDSEQMIRCINDDPINANEWDLIGTKQWSDVAGGVGHRCALDDGGQPHCVGSNASGQTGVGTSAYRYVPDRVGEKTWSFVQMKGIGTCAIDTEAQLFCWGGWLSESQTPTPEATPEPFEYVSGRYPSQCAIASSGALYCRVEDGEWNRVDANQDWRTIDFGSGLWCGLRGGVIACFPEETLVPISASPDSDWAELAHTLGLTCALKNDGTMWCVSEIERGGGFLQVGAMPGLRGVFLQNNWGCALDSEGAIWCGGPRIDLRRDTSQMNTFNQVSSSPVLGSFCGVETDGSLSCWGGGQEPLGTGYPPGSDPTVMNRTDWTDVSLGLSSACALNASNELWCWGDGAFGKLGFGDAHVEEFVPVVFAD